MDGSQGEIEGVALEPAAVRRFLADNPEFLRDDDGLLEELGLKVAGGGNVVDFGPAALARVHAAHQRESAQRQQIEETARANFSAQAQTHGAVIDLLESRNHSDLAWRLDEVARRRFGLAAGIIVLEDAADGFGRAPAGWKRLVEGQLDMVLGGPQRLARMGFAPTALPLFGEAAGHVHSMAMVRMSMWEPARAAMLAFGSEDPEGFTEDMGAELVAFLARVVERTAERWPIL